MNPLLQINPIAIEQMQTPLATPVSAGTASLLTPATGTMFDPISQYAVGVQRSAAEQARSEANDRHRDRVITQSEEESNLRRAQYNKGEVVKNNQIIADKAKLQYLLSTPEGMQSLSQVGVTSLDNLTPSDITNALIELSGNRATKHSNDAAFSNSKRITDYNNEQALVLANKRRTASDSVRSGKVNNYYNKVSASITNEDHLKLLTTMRDAGDLDGMKAINMSYIRKDIESLSGNIDKGLNSIPSKVFQSTNKKVYSTLYDNKIIPRIKTYLINQGLKPSIDQMESLKPLIKTALAGSDGSLTNSAIIRATVSSALEDRTVSTGLTGTSTKVTPVVTPEDLLQTADGNDRVDRFIRTNFGPDAVLPMIKDAATREMIAGQIIASDKIDNIPSKLSASIGESVQGVKDAFYNWFVD